MLCRRGHLVCKANLLSAVSRQDVLRLLQPSLHMLTQCLVVGGHHSTNSALCWSTGQRNWWSPSCRVVAGPGVAPASTSRQLTLLTHFETRLEALFVDTLSTHLDFRVEALMSYRHSHHQLSVLTHLDLPVEAHCRSSFFVDSSRLV